MSGVSKKTKVKKTSLSSVLKMLDNTTIKTEEEELNDFLNFIKKDKGETVKKSPESQMSIDKPICLSKRKKDILDILDQAWDHYEISEMAKSLKKQKL